MYLRITSSGTAVPEAFSLVGASTKRSNKSMIGMFGSGNKYALAYFMRNNIDFRVISNGEEITFSTVERHLGGQTFQVITINGENTSITTEMGHHWVLWQSIREIYSNAVDAGFVDMTIVDDPVAKEDGNTHIFIEYTESVEKMYKDFDNYFALNKVAIYKNEHGSIYKKHNSVTCVYRKGIRCIGKSTPSIFDYDLESIEINEDRLVKYSWSTPQEIWKMLYKCDDVEIIKKILDNMTLEIYESGIDDAFVSTFAEKLHDNWRIAIGSREICPIMMGGWIDDKKNTIFLPTRLYHDLVTRFGDELKSQEFRKSVDGYTYNEYDPTKMDIAILERVKEWFVQCEYDISDYEFKIVEFHHDSVHASFENHVILIDRHAFENGKDWIASCILEEIVHIKSGAGDESRKMQNALIREMINYMTVKNTNLL